MAKEQTGQPKEVTVEDKLKVLYELQKVSSKIDELRTLEGELPAEVHDMEDEVEGKKTRLASIEAQIKECETKRSDMKVKIENNNAAISRYKEQQDNVRNNREFDNLTKEIEFHELDNVACDKYIKECEVRLKELEVQKVQTTKEIEDRKVDLDQKRSSLNEILDDTKEKREELTLRVQALELTIEPRLLSAFKRVRKQVRNGIAVATIERGACGGCRSKVPAQRQLDIRIHKKIIPCEYCGRILVDPELAESVKA